MNYIIRGKEIYTPNSIVENGKILIKDGKIKDVGISFNND
jgi:dihydroorotase-like cyclic amidohydrolase